MKKNSGIRFLLKALMVLFTILLSACNKFIVLKSKGPVGHEEATLILVASVLMLLVVIPVFVMVFWFSVRYRASNTKARYMPNWAHSTKIEWVIWMVPVAIIAALSYLTWVKTHELDPYKPLKSNVKPIRIEVVSTDWNWLFIYPDYHVAIINQLVFPEKVPLSFKLTSASVMTSFFIPQLGSQMYAMAGMQTRLNLMASDTGVYLGQNEEYSGNGYMTMHFNAIATTQNGFETWLKKTRQSKDTLNMKTFLEFRKPNINYPVTRYASVEPGLFQQILGEYRSWMGGKDTHMQNTDTLKRDQMQTMPRTGQQTMEDK